DACPSCHIQDFRGPARDSEHVVKLERIPELADLVIENRLDHFGLRGIFRRFIPWHALLGIFFVGRELSQLFDGDRLKLIPTDRAPCGFRFGSHFSTPPSEISAAHPAISSASRRLTSLRAASSRTTNSGGGTWHWKSNSHGQPSPPRTRHWLHI